MIYGDVCTGIGAASVAWRGLGWSPAFFSEIDKYPCNVLKHHFPGVPLRGDFREIKGNEHGAIDLLVGGTPCQDFSVAGLRAGIAGERGGLTLSFVDLLERLHPRWFVWENVPGILSIDRGWAFSSFLGRLAKCGYGFAYRILDAQYFGVPQRRRRIFVAGYLGDWRRAAAVLFEQESLQGDIAPREAEGEGITGTLSARTKGGGGLGTDFDCAGGLISHTLRAEGFDASEDGSGRGMPLIPSKAWALQERDAKGADSNTKEGHLIPVAFDCKTSGSRGFAPCGKAPALRSMSGEKANGGGQVAVAFESRFARNGRGAPSSIVPPLKAQSGNTGKGDAAPLLQSGMAVRRLTPRECERLQGFPDDFTLININGKPCADAPRYRALGNSMAVPVMRWIGERIQAVEAIP